MYVFNDLSSWGSSQVAISIYQRYNQATVGWMVGSIIWVSIFPLIIGRMGNINSSSSRFSVFIIPDQHYHQGKDPMSM